MTRPKSLLQMIADGAPSNGEGAHERPAPTPARVIKTHPSHKLYCAGYFGVTGTWTTGNDSPGSMTIRCTCAPNRHVMRVEAFNRTVVDQRARGIDPWSPKGWAERANGSPKKGAP